VHIISLFCTGVKFRLCILLVFRRLHRLLQVAVVLMGGVLRVKFNNVVPRLEC
jgi:hypothetical protein